MSSFINNLINRHINTENLIKPRFRSMFETESLSQGKSAINKFKVNSHDDLKTQGLNSDKEPASDSINDQDSKNKPVTFKQPGTLSPKDDENDLQTEKPATTPKFNTPIQDEEKNNHEKLVKVSQFAGDIKDSKRKQADIIDYSEKINADSSIIIKENANKQSTSNLNTYRTDLTRSFSNIDQTTAPEQLKNQFQNHNSKVNAYSGTAFFDKYIPSKSMQQSAPKQPAIKVTIGQIDVKAISEPQPASTKNKNTAEPRMSLDDYLKMRNSSKK